jgi:hypothetical protein
MDMHTHVYRYAINLAVDSDIVGFKNGVTTVLDCGSTSSGSFMGLREYVMEGAQTRIYALLNISSIGLIVTNEIYLDPMMIKSTRRHSDDQKQPRSSDGCPFNPRSERDSNLFGGDGRRLISGTRHSGNGEASPHPGRMLWEGLESFATRAHDDLHRTAVTSTPVRVSWRGENL